MIHKTRALSIGTRQFFDESDITFRNLSEHSGQSEIQAIARAMRGRMLAVTMRRVRDGFRLTIAWGYFSQVAANEVLASMNCLGGQIYGLVRK